METGEESTGKGLKSIGRYFESKDLSKTQSKSFDESKTRAEISLKQQKENDQESIRKGKSPECLLQNPYEQKESWKSIDARELSCLELFQRLKKVKL